MIKIIGVKFRKPGKVYYFDPTCFTVQKGDHVIVETARGVEYGTVVLGPKEVTDDQVVQPLKPLMRVATVWSIWCMLPPPASMAPTRRFRTAPMTR